jgi:transposase-like protein
MDDEGAPSEISEFPKTIPVPVPKKRGYGNRYTTGKHVRKFSDEFKASVVDAYTGGMSSRELSDKQGISVDLVSRWVREAGHGQRARVMGEMRKEPVEAESGDPLQLRLELARVQGEVALLKELLLGYLK